MVFRLIPSSGKFEFSAPDPSVCSVLNWSGHSALHSWSNSRLVLLNRKLKSSSLFIHVL